MRLATARALGLAVVVASLAAAPSARAHEGNPNYDSSVTAVEPGQPGLEVQVLNYDDSLELRNQTGDTVIVYGYRGEPYLRIERDGKVEVNRRSPATYLNDDRFGTSDVPERADPDAEPVWQTLEETGGHTWHDHRIHWMSRNLPPQVTDKDERTKVFDWKVPISVGGETAAIEGELFWEPEPSGGVPTGALIALALIVLAALAAVAVVRRRRAAGSRSRESGEAW